MDWTGPSELIINIKNKKSNKKYCRKVEMASCQSKGGPTDRQRVVVDCFEEKF